MLGVGVDVSGVGFEMAGVGVVLAGGLGVGSAEVAEEQPAAAARAKARNPSHGSFIA